MKSKDKHLKFIWALPFEGNENSSFDFQGDQKFTNDVTLDSQINFCRVAEKLGFDGILLDTEHSEKDSILLAVTLANYSDKIKYTVALKSRLLSPTLFTQQANTFSVLHKNRIALNISLDYSKEEHGSFGDLISFEERFDHTEEFLEICNAFWKKDGPVNFSGKYFNIVDGILNTPFLDATNERPYISVMGDSLASEKIAVNQADCWIRMWNKEKPLFNSKEPALNYEIDLGLRMSINTRANAEEIQKVSANLTMDQNVLSGTYEEVAEVFMRFRKNGINTFVLSGISDQDDLYHFGKNVLPLIRKQEMAL